MDAMRHRVSFLRKQVQEEEENIKTTQRELVNLEAKCTSVSTYSNLKIYSLVGSIKMIWYFMQHIRNGLIIDLINS